ncbi:MAG: hypothetical protein LBT00_15610 [Spirochaetaceae bacterium]|jgi:predicted nucleic acid-binding protein|nr:hypothetical protein [Spirochaetaceae bacterium]
MTGSIDVCGAMEILMRKEKADKLSKVLKEATLVIAPDLYIAELTNTLWKYHRGHTPQWFELGRSEGAASCRGKLP